MQNKIKRQRERKGHTWNTWSKQQTQRLLTLFYQLNCCVCVSVLLRAASGYRRTLLWQREKCELMVCFEYGGCNKACATVHMYLQHTLYKSVHALPHLTK